MSGWLIFDGGASMASFRAHAKQIDTVSAEWIVCKPDGHAGKREHPTVAEQKELLSVARKNGVRVLAMTSNSAGGFNPAVVEKALASEAMMHTHANELVKVALDAKIDGIDLDYELLKAQDRTAYSKFVKIVADTCHAHGLKVAVALHPKTSEPGTWDGAQAQDYAAIGRAVDYVRVMTYDQHWETSEAGPVASPDWVTQIAKFAASVVPASKLELGIPSYGYDWVGKKAESMGWDEFVRRAKSGGGASRDAASQELIAKYGDHTVYFADGVAARAKFPIAKSLGLRGVAMWRFGSEDPSFWTELAKARK